MSVCFAVLLFAVAPAETPNVFDERLQLQLVADSPDVRTPTGIAVDDAGRVLVIESHTHFRPQDYDGPKHDRILLLEDFDPATGKAGKISTFFEGTTHTMNLAVYHDGSVFVATRSEIFRLFDRDGDGKSDARRPVCRLETPGNYPHNGLSGFAFDFAGNVYFGFGENLGADYKLIGSDHKTLTGGGEGGNIYCCNADGGNLRRVATGFWNPFHLCFDAFGRLFAVDNDPDSRPPCRLLHIVEGGDYGFRFRHGRKGVHPFTSWNGELPGTLPMVAGTGEAPSGMLAYESDNLPAEYVGDLLVTSWGDHRIERYKLRPHGASFTSEMQPVVRGGENFRPVGIALAPDGSLYISDWVDKSYNLHGKGRVWRLSAKQPAKRTEPNDDWESLMSPHGPARQRALHRLRFDDVLGIERDVPLEDGARALLGSKQEQAQAAALQLIDPRNYYGQSLLVGLVGSHSSPNVRSAVAHKLAEARSQPLAGSSSYPSYRGSSMRMPPMTGWSEEGTAILLSDARTRAFALSEINDYWSKRAPAGTAQRSFPAPDPAARESVWRVAAEDPFILHAMSLSLAAELTGARSKRRTTDEFARMDSKAPPERLAMALAAWRSGIVQPHELVPELLASPIRSLRLVGLLWAAEAEPDHVEDFRRRVEGLLERAKYDRQELEVALATLDVLSGRGIERKQENAGAAYLVELVANERTPQSALLHALEMLPPDHPALTKDQLLRLVDGKDAQVRLAALRTLRLRSGRDHAALLREVAASGERDTYERCEAILGLLPEDAEDRRLLMDLTESDDAQISAEALRVLRGVELTADERSRLTNLKAKVSAETAALVEKLLASPQPPAPRPENAADWLVGGTRLGNPAIGSRIFFNSRVGSCYKCHQHSGRGSQIGPDLSTIGQSMQHDRLLESIVDPSREVAPQFTTWTIRTTDGQVKTGLHVGDEVDGRMRFVDSAGAPFHLHPDEIDERQPSQQSIMPAGVAEQLTPQELRDLLAFLRPEKTDANR